MNRVLGPGGYIEAVVGPAYEVRQGQIEMARACMRAVEDGRSIMAEGPTGVGKSFAYLIPALAALQRGLASRVIVATANITLQDQLVTKDLPLLARVAALPQNTLLPKKISYGLLKGRGNYLCLSKKDELLGLYAAHLDGEELKPYVDRIIHDPSTPKLLEWMGRTTTGDRSELDFEPEHWEAWSTQGEDCPGKKCAFHDDCYASNAIARAMSRKVIVTNYHLLLISQTLPAAEVLICDEAHELADIARDVGGWQMTERGFRQLIEWLKANDKDESAGYRLSADVQALFEALERFVGKSQNRRIRSWSSVNYDISGLYELLNLGSMRANERIEQIEAGIESLTTKGHDLGAAGLSLSLAATLRVANRFAKSSAALLELATSNLLESNTVYWVTKDDRSVKLASSLIRVGESLQEGIFAGRRSTILSSATLTTGGSFEFIRKELGFSNTSEVIAPSPFNLQRQGIIVVPDSIPMPEYGDDQKLRAYYEAVIDAAEELILLCRGRSLMLFTSWAVLDLVYTALMQRRVQWPFPVTIYKQGDAPRIRLIEAFKNDVDSVLLGVRSFWQGIDIPGDALTGLFIDKIPFPVPDDPKLEALNEYVQSEGGNPFFDIALPRATIALRQGVGRLIRRRTDIGVVVITDRRLIEKSYGDYVVRSLPDFEKAKSMRYAREFMDDQMGHKLYFRVPVKLCPMCKTDLRFCDCEE